MGGQGGEGGEGGQEGEEGEQKPFQSFPFPAEEGNSEGIEVTDVTAVR